MFAQSSASQESARCPDPPLRHFRFQSFSGHQLSPRKSARQRGLSSSPQVPLKFRRVAIRGARPSDGNLPLREVVRGLCGALRGLRWSTGFPAQPSLGKRRGQGQPDVEFVKAQGQLTVICPHPRQNYQTGEFEASNSPGRNVSSRELRVKKRYFCKDISLESLEVSHVLDGGVLRVGKTDEGATSGSDIPVSPLCQVKGLGGRSFFPAFFGGPGDALPECGKHC